MALRDDLTTLIYVAGRPVRVDEAVVSLGVDPEDLLQLVESLAAGGVVSDTETGIGLTDEAYTPGSASRASFLAGKWADALRSLDGDPAEIGMALLAAGRRDSAVEFLVPEALSRDSFDLIDAALGAVEEGASIATEEEGRLRLARARHCRGRGESLRAAEDLAMAVRQLQGPELVDALGFAAAVADDLQRPQESETLAALAAREALRVGEPAKQGSLLTLHGRQLSRIGFPQEAERSMEVGRRLLDDHGNETQRDYGHWNRAWVMLDRGSVREAEAEFGILRDHALHGDPVVLAEREAYWARSLFGIGHVTEALEAAARAEALAEEHGAGAPRFIAALARMEGGLLLGRYEDALGHATDAYERSIPSYVNVPLVGQARALAGLGRVDEAKEKLAAAVSATPAGTNGWRWRIHAEVVEMGLIPQSADWPQRRAEDLTDALLQSRWYDFAVVLMSERARRESDKDLGLQGASLALQIGNPMLAAEAVEAAGAWKDPMVSVVARAVVQMGAHIPEEWREEWLALPAVASAHGVDLTDHADEVSELERRIEDALAAAGLGGVDTILSPAQRQARGLVRRRPLRRRRILASVGAAAAVVVLSAATALGVNYLVAEEPVVERVIERVVEAASPTVPAEPVLEETIVEVPGDTGVFGVAAYRGGNTRSGVTTGGFRTVLGKYWDIQLAGSISAGPVARGNLFYLGVADPDELLFLVTNNGTILTASVNTGGRVRSAPAFDPAGGDPPYLVFGSDDGRLYALHAGQGQSYWNPPKDLGGAISASPLLFDYITVAVTEDGVLRALSIEDIGEGVGVEQTEVEVVEWTYTGTETQPLGSVSSSPASDGEAIYVMDEEGWIHVVDVFSGAPLCEPILGNGALARGANPVVSGDFVFFPTASGYLDRLRLDSCTPEPLLFVGPSVFDFPVVVDNGTVYAVEGPWLNAFDVPEDALQAASLWTFTAEGQDPISTAPVYAEGVLYFGTRGGTVYAVDATDGTEVWRFDVGEAIVGAPAVLDNAVIVTSQNRVWAIAGE